MVGLPFEFPRIGALEMARRISDQAVSSLDLVESHIARIEKTHSRLNAMASRRFESALAEAKAADEWEFDARRHRPFHGVPVSVKECFGVEGMATTLGNRSKNGPVAPKDSRVVQRLKEAGAIIVGKTNVPQLMIYNECTNPHFGRTVNPWDEDRTCGGSSGGSAALLAAGGVALEIGSDAGGSVRVPAHFCGVHALMPTPGIISRAGMIDGIPGMGHLEPVIAPMARRVEDLVIAGNILAEPMGGRFHWLRHPNRDAIRNLRIAFWPTLDAFPVSPAIRRGVEFAKSTLCEMGATVVDLEPPPLVELLRYFAALWMADGGNTVRRQLNGGGVDPHVKRMVLSGRLPKLARSIYESWLRHQGDHETADIIKVSHRRSVEQYWKMSGKLSRLRQEYLRDWVEAEVDAVVCPPYGLPAILHGQALDLIQASSYAVWVNLFGLPAGILSLGHVKPSEEGIREGNSTTAKLAKEVDSNSAGLPVAAQIVARPHCEQVIVEIMSAIEASIPQGDNPAMNVPPSVRSMLKNPTPQER